MFLYHHGIKNKAIGGHKMNMTSSRSHTVLTFTLEQVHVSNPDNTIISKL
jgi:Kinesin motor domain